MWRGALDWLIVAVLTYAFAWMVMMNCGMEVRDDVQMGDDRERWPVAAQHCGDDGDGGDGGDAGDGGGEAGVGGGGMSCREMIALRVDLLTMRSLERANAEAEFAAETARSRDLDPAGAFGCPGKRRRLPSLCALRRSGVRIDPPICGDNWDRLCAGRPPHCNNAPHCQRGRLDCADVERYCPLVVPLAERILAIDASASSFIANVTRAIALHCRFERSE
jgi:hypothetical protein